MPKHVLRKVVIPAGGLGTRFLPATIAQPKEMLPLIDKPTIQFVVEEAINAKLNDIVMVTGKSKRAIEDHFDPNPELLALLESKGKKELIELIEQTANLGNFFFVRQKKALGLGHAVLQAKQHIDGENFAVMLGDTIIDQDKPCIGEMAKIFSKFGAPVIAIEEVDPSRVSQYGIVSVTKQISATVFEIDGIVEKPGVGKAPSNLAVAARYIFTPAIFALLEKTAPGKNGEIQLTDAISQYLKKNKCLAYKIPGQRLDIGSKAEYAKAFVKLGLRHPDVKDELKEYLKELMC